MFYAFIHGKKIEIIFTLFYSNVDWDELHSIKTINPKTHKWSVKMPKEVLYGYGKAKPYYFTTQLTLYGKGLVLGIPKM